MSTEVKIRGMARVQIIIEIPCSVWGGDCSIQQLHDQAASEARGRVIKAISEMGVLGMKIIGDPKVVGVLTEEER